MWNTGEVILIGRYRNLHIKTSGSGVTVNGSLSRYWFESNALTPGFGDCREALDELAEGLGSSMSAMQVYRLDIAATLKVRHPCPRYLWMFGNMPRFSRFQRAGGLLYKTKRRELDFYDKRAEARSRKEPLPACFDGWQTLRYELRYKQQLMEQFGGKVTADRLIEAGFFRTLVQRWESSYQRIHKQVGTLALNLDTSNPKSFGTSLEHFGIEHLGGEAAVLKELQLRRDMGEIHRLNYSRMRARVTRLCRNSNNQQRNDPISELDTVIAQEAERLRSFL